ncbi:MAG TPA: SDR family oxidoreductase [Chitinophagaceae bacterium]
MIADKINQVSAEFFGKAAIITGAGQGIGFEIASQLAANGAGVLLNDIDPVLATRAAENINAKYDRCMAFPGDAGDVPTITQMVESAVHAFGSIDIAIANAGITLFGDFLDYSPEAFYSVLNTNLGGSFFLAQQVARQMKLQGTGGSILFMSSVTGHQAHKQLAAYGMTKAGLEMLAKTLVIELSPFRITVNAIAPGSTMTERTKEDTEYERIWSAITPMGRPAQPTDVAAAALFLVSPKARHITGQSLVVDGGWTSVSPSPYDA